MGLRNVAIWSISQDIDMSGVSMVVLPGGIVGSSGTTALLGDTAHRDHDGGGLFAILAALLMQRIGRHWGFIAATVAAGPAALLAAYAIAQGSLFLF